MLGKKHKSSEETQKIFINKPNNNNSIITSNKPLWISDVSQSVKKIFPNPIEAKEFEQIKDLMQAETSAELFDNSEYPYYQTIKKIMYAFGDNYCNNQDTVIYMHDFIKKYLLYLNQIFIECDFKKIIDHFFSYEYEKIHNYKKLKFKNNILTGENDFVIGEDIKISSNDLNVGNDNNILSSNDDESFNLDTINNNNNNIQKKNKKNKNKKKADIENVIEDRDEYYAENIIFQSERTENMDTNQYLEYYSCRQHGLLTKGKKPFSDYLETLFGNKYPIELKEYSNIELIAFILKEEIKKIVIEAIKAKHIDKKLFILNYPLVIEDIDYLCQEELNKFTEFLNDFHSDLSLIRIFKKKQISDKKQGNKNVKVKKTNQGLFIIINKFALIGDKDESEQFKTIKKNAEVQALNAILILRDNLIILKHEKSKQSQDLDVNYDKMNFINNKVALISIKDLIAFLGIDNYYEYFLIKDYLFPINIKEIKLNELMSKISLFGKINKKTVANKFNIWIQMTNDERNVIITQFNQLSANKDK